MKIVFFKSKKAEDAPSLKPPKEWWERHYADVKEKNPNYSDEQVRATVGAIWYKLMSKNQRKKRREDEGKKYGPAPEPETNKSWYDFHAEPLRKALKAAHNDWTDAQIEWVTECCLTDTKTMRKSRTESYNAVSDFEFKNMPAIVVDRYKDGEWMERKLCTAPMVLDEPENYDTATFWLLINALSNDRYSTDLKRLELLIDTAKTLKERLEELEELQAKQIEKTEVGQIDNFKKRGEWMFGKSIIFISPEAELDERLKAI